ncbi:hypothetical protein LTR62_000415 [Meristemomyces frigidus]|uniref:Mid2 domain-containing protein n=1 Tax=Meristemomyces frigidus TaxID=1508187 RepID=A0AAN7TMM9_9PEZI|nr:hypothetical protein LTR62_000415 [Meristemomyces frigidus]
MGTMRKNALALLLSAATLSNALPQATQGSSPSSTAASPTPTITQASTTDSASGSASTSVDVPLSLWSQAESLLSSYYPSSSITQVDSLTWPSAVVIASSTYNVISESQTSSTASPTATNKSKLPSNAVSSDAKLGIGIGVAVGAVALAVLALVLCCLHRRKKSTGRFFNRRATPSITDSDIGTWRSPMQRHSSTLMSSGRQNNWAERYEPMPEAPEMSYAPHRTYEPATELQPPPMSTHPAYAGQHSNYSSSEDNNPFFTPEERSEQHQYELAGDASLQTQAHHNEPVTMAARRSWESLQQEQPIHIPQAEEQEARPRTPFNPMRAMLNTNNIIPARKPVPAQVGHSNPFSHPSDSEADAETEDLVSPILPSRSPERRHSPMIHYPSWNEVSEFDFGEEGRRGRGMGSGESNSGGEEGRLRRESVVGRHELA